MNDQTAPKMSREQYEHEEKMARTFAMASQVSALAVVEFFSGAAYIDITPKTNGAGYTVWFRRNVQKAKTDG